MSDELPNLGAVIVDELGTFAGEHGDLPAQAAHRTATLVRVRAGEPLIEAVNGYKPVNGERVAEALTYGVTAPARVLKWRFGREPLRCDVGEVRQDWGALQEKHHGRGAGARARDRFSREVKACAGDHEMTLRPMNGPTVSLGKVQCVKITVNDPAALRHLPPLDGNLEDSVMLLKGYAEGGPIAPGKTYLVGEPGPAPLAWPDPAPAANPAPRPDVHDLPLGRPQID